MTESLTLPVKMNKTEVQVTSDCFCTQLTYSIKPYRRDYSNYSCQYEIHSDCVGTNVVNVKCGPDTYKCHDGCLLRISDKLGKPAKHNAEITIDDRFDPAIVNKALTYAFNPEKLQIELLSSKEKFDMVVFAAHYNFVLSHYRNAFSYVPEHNIHKLVDRSNFVDLVQYAWENHDLYLMKVLPEMRIVSISIWEDFKKIDEKIVLQFIGKYLEHKISEKKFKRNIKIGLISFVFFLLFLFTVWCVYYNKIAFK